MSLPALIEHLAGPWAALYNNSKVLITAVTFAHLSGLLLGGGAAVVSDRAAIRFSRAGADEQRRHLRDLRDTHRIVLAGLTITLVTGILMLGADVSTFLESRVFWLKMALVALLLTNGVIILRAEQMARRAPSAGWRWLRATAYVSLALWFLTVFLGTAMATLG